MFAEGRRRFLCWTGYVDAQPATPQRQTSKTPARTICDCGHFERRDFHTKQRRAGRDLDCDRSECTRTKSKILPELPALARAVAESDRDTPMLETCAQSRRRRRRWPTRDKVSRTYRSTRLAGLKGNQRCIPRWPPSGRRGGFCWSGQVDALATTSQSRTNSKIPRDPTRVRPCGSFFLGRAEDPDLFRSFVLLVKPPAIQPSFSSLRFMRLSSSSKPFFLITRLNWFR
jgi:hypothetical protein